MSPYNFYRIEYVINDVAYHKVYLSKHRLDNSLSVPEAVAKKLRASIDCEPIFLDFLENYGKAKG